MSISHYSFDNANADGDKEAVIIPNTPTLINKLSANETNNIKDKINEIIDNLESGGSSPDPLLFTAVSTGTGQTFTGVTFKAGTVLKSKGELFKGTEWTQTGNTVTILVNVNTGNSIYIKP